MWITANMMSGKCIPGFGRQHPVCMNNLRTTLDHVVSKKDRRSLCKFIMGDLDIARCTENYDIRPELETIIETELPAEEGLSMEDDEYLIQRTCVHCLHRNGKE